MYLFYRALTGCFSPLVPLFLNRRLKRGKEDPLRIGERMGRSNVARPQGKLLWIHAASVGEANAVLPLMVQVHAQYPSLQLLLTTVTVTSANLLKELGQTGFIHQFAPVDTPGAVRAFLRHWKPDIALWVDSELWPNLIIQARKRNALLGIINARISQRSFRRWSIVRSFSKRILSCFSLCFAQGDDDASRLLALGMRSIDGTGNLKYDAPPLACNEEERKRLQVAIGQRPVWLAASTHPGEEAMIAAVHRTLALTLPSLLTLIVPRHASRGDGIVRELSGFSVAQRSKGQSVDPATEIYLADTMGELGLFYRLAPIACIGGSLVPHGGQNPLEAAKLGCAVIFGPHMENFTSIARAMGQADAAVQVSGADALADAVAVLFADEAQRFKLGMQALAHVRSHEGITRSIMNRLQPYLA